jgi:hypothetical protein
MDINIGDKWRNLMNKTPLATIEKVLKVIPCPNSVNLDIVSILGWNVICKRNEIKENELCCFIRIDSILPAIPYFSFMEQRKYRVKTIKLRGQISQGLIIPYNDIEIICNQNGEDFNLNWKEGDQLDSYLHITKWLSPSEREADYVGTPKKKHNWFIRYMTRYDWFRKTFHKKSKSFPEWISKTDEERVQNMPWILKNKTPMIVTEKIDGQSATYWIKKKWFGFEYGICSRSVLKFEYDNSNWSKAFRELDIKNKLKQLRDYLGYDLAIQGELISPKVQGNHYNVNCFKLYVFNMYDINKKKYLEYYECKSNCAQVNLECVPYITSDYILPDTIKEIVDFSIGNSVLVNKQREGVVIRTPDKSISFKVINPEFLLNKKDE